MENANSPVSAKIELPHLEVTPRPILKRSNTTSDIRRFDRMGNLIRGKTHRITFVDRIKNVPVHTVIEIEPIVYPEIQKTKNKCCKCVLV